MSSPRNPSTGSTDIDRAVAYLRSARAIRERCRAIYEAGLDGKLTHFSIHPDRLPKAARLVAQITRQNYPDLAIPFHCRGNHFRVGGVDRVGTTLVPVPGDALETARTTMDLTVVSVLLDAGAGDGWSYIDRQTQTKLSRSEGLAVASLEFFLRGGFSHRHDKPWQVSADGLIALREDTLAEGFQVRRDNPLLGLSGRVQLLRELGRCLKEQPERFGQPARLGNWVEWFHRRAEDERIQAAEVLSEVLYALAPIWPHRLRLGNQNLGDVFRHRFAGGTGPTEDLVPFHKLSQWLTYSMVEPLEHAALDVERIEALTGLAEYRNGGLFVDSRVLELKHDVHHALDPSEELIVEWRALTVTLLDEIAPLVRAELGVGEERMPLARILEGGTWATGRALAFERRGGTPPIQVKSDGTVF